MLLLLLLLCLIAASTVHKGKGEGGEVEGETGLRGKGRLIDLGPSSCCFFCGTSALL